MHTRLPRPLPALLALSLLGALSLQAQPSSRTPDEKWSDLVQLTKSRPANPGNRNEAAAVKQAQQAHLQSVANEAAKFTRDHPAHAKVPEARRLETKSRLTVALLTADTPSTTVKTLATDVRRDSRLSEAERFEVAFLAEMASEESLHTKSRAVWQSSRDRSARALMAEFPQQPGGYGLLLQVAERGTGARAVSAARDLVASSAPTEIKAAARILLERQALVGQTLAGATSGVLGSARVFEPASGKQLILYTWRPENAGSIALAKELARLAPADAVIIGINLSRDATATMAAVSQLPGVQLYDGRAFDSPLVSRLQLSTAPLVYLVDRQGVIRSTDAQNDLAAQLASLEGKR